MTRRRNARVNPMSFRRWAQCGAAAILPLAFGAAASDPNPAIPNFSSTQFGWIAQGVNYQMPESGPHHVTQHPDHPWQAPGRGEAPMWRIADLNNPILQPWTREELKKNNERILAGGTGYTRQVSCWPMGTPAFLLYPAQPIYFVQTPEKVTMISQMDHQIRQVGLNVPHSQKVRPSYYGESIGHYEGDTLVVDTIGVDAKNTWVDNFRTPHSDNLHVIERFRMIDGGKVLEVDLHVEDPDAFTMPWNAVQRYARTDQEFVESICAENNPMHLGQLDPMPEAKTPDF
jgi:hypothetical protein